MYLFILFIIFPFLILPAAASKNDICLAKPPDFFHRVVVSNFSKTCVKLCLMNSPVCILEKYGFFHFLSFFFFSPLRCNVRLSMPSSPHVLSIKELGHCASKFEQTNSHVEIVHPNKLQTLACPVAVYLCCL